MRFRYAVLALACTLAFAAAAQAQTTYVGVLTGGTEVPPVVTGATGNATVVLNAAQTQISISVQFQNLIGTYANSHIHGPAPAGSNAPVKWGFGGVAAGWVFSNATTPRKKASPLVAPYSAVLPMIVLVVASPRKSMLGRTAMRPPDRPLPV